MILPEAWRDVEHLTRHQRKATPPDLADYLVDRLRLLSGSICIAALWLESVSPYRRMPGVEPWGVERDANRYNGPWPIVAHPPCGPWGKLSWSSRESKLDGINSMTLVHRWGGVVEQPAGSRLIRDYAQPGAEIERIRQLDFGHSATKATLLYWYIPGLDLAQLFGQG